MNVFGQKIKQLREEHGLFQRHLCVALEIDTPMYSKIERGERKAKRSQIPIMAKVFGVDEKATLGELAEGYYAISKLQGTRTEAAADLLQQEKTEAGWTSRLLL